MRPGYPHGIDKDGLLEWQARDRFSSRDYSVIEDALYGSNRFVRRPAFDTQRLDTIYCGATPPSIHLVYGQSHLLGYDEFSYSQMVGSRVSPQINGVMAMHLPRRSVITMLQRRQDHAFR